MRKNHNSMFSCFKYLFFVFVLFGFIFVIQTNPASACDVAEFIIVNDATGGDCDSGPDIGVWDPATRTCTLDGDVDATGDRSAIEIASNGITLDCAGFQVDGDDCDGVIANGRSNITVKNCDIVDASDGFDFFAVTGANILSNSVFSGSSDGAELEKVNSSYFINNTFDTSSDGFDMDDSHNNYFINNTLTCAQDNFDIDDSHRNHFIGNSATGGNEGFDIDDANANKFVDNDASSNGQDGFDIGSKSRNNTFLYNTADSNAQDGFKAKSSSKNNFFKDNSATGNGDDDMDDDSTGNKTAGTANTYLNNDCGSSEQAGPGVICD